MLGFIQMTLLVNLASVGLAIGQLTRAEVEELCIYSYYNETLHNSCGETGRRNTNEIDKLKQEVEILKTASSGLKDQVVFLQQTFLAQQSSLGSSQQNCISTTTTPNFFDCTDILRYGQVQSGNYRINVAGSNINVYCDLKTSGGGWLVFQRRGFEGKENFSGKSWNDYKYGFGDATKEYWLGNENLYRLTSKKMYKLRIDLEDFEGNKRYAEYSQFSIGSSGTNYRLSVAGYSGDAGDSLAPHNGYQFSTYDADHDVHTSNNCASVFKGAWWYDACHYSNLNGAYLRGTHSSYADGIEWYFWTGYYYSLKSTEMKIAVK